MVRKTKKDKFAEYIVEYIDNNPILKKKFSHHKQKISIETLFSALIDKLEKGIPYSQYINTKYNITWI